MRPPIVRTVRDALTVALVLVPVVPGQTTLVSATTGDLFGFSVDVAGDYGTPAGFPAGVRDLVVGAPWRNSAAGAIDIVATPASGTTATAKVLSTLNGAAPGDGLGWAVAAGDVDADGIPDVVVSAPFFAGSGAVAAFSGAALATNTFTLLWFRLAPAGVTSYGFALSLAATTTPGVFDRLVVGAPNSNIVEVLAASSGRIHCDDVDFGSSTVSALTISDCQYVTLNRSGFRTRFRVLELDRPAGNRPVFDRSCFYDPSHLSTDGARAFSRYLAEQLVACEELPLDQDPPPRLLPSSGIVFAGKRAADGSNRIEFMADQLPFVGEAVVIASTEKRETRLPKGVRLGVPWPTPHVQALKRDSLYRASGAVEWAGIDPSKPLYLQLTVVEKDVVLGVSPVVELPPHR